MYLYILIYTNLYIYMYIYVCVHIYIYIALIYKSWRLIAGGIVTVYVYAYYMYT
jgi:hypothetical protein